LVISKSIIAGVIVAGAATSCVFWGAHRADRFAGVEARGSGDLACHAVDPESSRVRWIQTGDASELPALAEGCASVGPAVVRETTNSDGLPVIDSLIVASWNVHVGGGDIREFVGRLRSGEFSGGRPPRHFVVLLQETFCSSSEVPPQAQTHVVPRRIQERTPAGDREDIVTAASILDLNLFYVPSMRNGSTGSGPTEDDRGNAILSTLPLSDLTAIELPLERFRRVAVAATVTGLSAGGEAWSLRVCAVHLDLRTDFPRVLQSAGVGRERQARALVSALPENDLVLGGDFNTWAPSPVEGALACLARSFPQSVEADRRPTVPIRLFPDRRLDRMFFRLSSGRRARYARLDHEFGSDHYALVGTVPLIR
jgi:endonuclease/exonuclease/phosphatase family metal-dependent hydrolase